MSGATSAASPRGRWPRVIGIVGGLGPHAHIAFESQLLAAVPGAARDQDYPAWIVSSLPDTPDRTRALLDDGPSPVPRLVDSLRNLEGRADFAVVACQTVHAFLDAARAQVRIPILDLVHATVRHLADVHGADARIGLLATTGTLRARLYPKASADVAPGLTWRSLPDLPDGDALQQDLVMRPIYGADGRGGLKAGRDADAHDGRRHADRLGEAADRLLDDGCQAVVLGCTEIPLALDVRAAEDARLVDPLQIAAARCLAIAAGDAPLPPR
ncbi:MAG: amino acid racemase [Acidobacteriota bacterium]